MVKQISLDAWQIQQLEDLLEKGSDIVAKTNRPIVLFRQTLEEEEARGEIVMGTWDEGMLDNTLIVYLQEGGGSHHSNNLNMPAVLIGNLGKRLKAYNRKLYYAQKYVLIALILVAIIWWL